VVAVPTLTCFDIAAKTNSCSECIANSLSLVLQCCWCLSSYNASDGKCTPTGGCPSNITFDVCPTHINFNPGSCPDACSGNGKCINSTDSQYSTAVKNQQGSGFLTANGSVCFCNEGFSGINCGQYPAPSNSVLILAAGIGTGAVVGIIIAAVLIFIGCGGGGAFAYSQLHNEDKAAVLGNNPLFVDPAKGGNNPLNRAC